MSGEFHIQPVILIVEFLAVSDRGGRIIQHSLIYRWEVFGDKFSLLGGEGQFIVREDVLSIFTFVGRDACQPLPMVGLVAGCAIRGVWCPRP